jgi:hypothetical protein
MVRSRPMALLKSLGCLAALLLALGAIVAGVAMVQSSLEVVERPPAEGEAELDAVVARFGVRTQYLDLVRRDGVITTHVHHEREPAHPGRITALHGLLWEAGPRRLVRASVPAWAFELTRWKADLTAPLLAPFEKRLGLEVSLPDLAPFGPGLVLDHHGHHDRRVVLWAEGKD